MSRTKKLERFPADVDEFEKMKADFQKEEAGETKTDLPAAVPAWAVPEASPAPEAPEAAAPPAPPASMAVAIEPRQRKSGPRKTGTRKQVTGKQIARIDAAKPARLQNRLWLPYTYMGLLGLLPVSLFVGMLLGAVNWIVFLLPWIAYCFCGFQFAAWLSGKGYKPMCLVGSVFLGLLALYQVAGTMPWAAAITGLVAGLIFDRVLAISEQWHNHKANDPGEKSNPRDRARTYAPRSR